MNLLLQFGANPIIQNSVGETCLHWACTNDHVEVVKLLLQAGSNKADPSIQNSMGHTCLHLACIYGHVGVVKLLLENNVDPNIQDNDGNTCMTWAKTQEIKDLLK